MLNWLLRGVTSKKGNSKCFWRKKKEKKKQSVKIKDCSTENGSVTDSQWLLNLTDPLIMMRGCEKLMDGRWGMEMRTNKHVSHLYRYNLKWSV